MIKKVLLALVLLLTACNTIIPSSQTIYEALEESSGSPPKSTAEGDVRAATHNPPTPAATSTPGTSPTPFSSPSSTPTPTPPHPLTIDYLRRLEYPASEVVIEETLERGFNYSRYIASYRSEELKINALLTVPDGEPPETGWPVIIFNHGYIPPSEYRTTERYVYYVDGFARNGYIVFRSDYRGHAFSEGVARGGYGNPDYTIDVLNAVAAMKNYPLADPNRIGMWGHSMGGYITLRSMVVSRDIKAGVIWAGVVASYPDLLTRWRRNTRPAATRTSRWRNEMVETYGPPEENPEFWSSISSNSYLASLSGPIQLHHGTQDTSVPIEFSTVLAGQIREAGGYVEYYIYDGDNHNLSINFNDAMSRSIEFFDIYVKGVNP